MTLTSTAARTEVARSRDSAGDGSGSDGSGSDGSGSDGSSPERAKAPEQLATAATGEGDLGTAAAARGVTGDRIALPAGAPGEDAYGRLATAWATRSATPLGPQAGRQLVRPLLEGLRERLGAERFSEARGAYEARARAGS
ncbi:hypothetical protein [Streptomyces sp. NBC_00503]|uniref:hypothetical protein n=1 Tax=Streptomyces sp. NBC_00503 TaxID=2903659 RepID=UPI002E8240B3|nr:hypothetical protein [Streptomyces sp. NBC_00503]WUD84490.1 hypothetical protein OG490_30195 [Streptomyces sp. NBC_00503]